MRGRVPELPLCVLWPSWIVSSSLEKLGDGLLGVDHEPIGQLDRGGELGLAVRLALALREDFLGQLQQRSLQ